MDVYGAPPAGLSGDYYGGHPFGVLAEELATEGVDGPGYLAPCVTLPADAGKRVRGPITRWPAAGLTVYADGAFDYPAESPSDYALFWLIVDGEPSTQDIGFGSGIGRIDLNVGSGLSGNVQLDDVQPGGTLMGAVTLGGNVQLDDAQGGGGMVGVLRQVRAPISATGARPLQRSTARRPKQ